MHKTHIKCPLLLELLGKNATMENSYECEIGHIKDLNTENGLQWRCIIM